MSNVKIVKDTNSKTVYMALPVADEKAFESYCQNYGIEIKKARRLYYQLERDVEWVNKHRIKQTTKPHKAYCEL